MLGIVLHEVLQTFHELGSFELILAPQDDYFSAPGPSSLHIPVPSHLPISFPAEASGAIEFVADPAALATILSGEGVKSCPIGRQSSLAQRVLIRGSKGGTIRRGQVMR